VLAIGVWLGVLRGIFALPPGLDGVSWHAHEMLFGYVGAVVAGFLLTAVRNWTGTETATGPTLAALALLWLAARLAPWLGAPRPGFAALDIAFFPMLALSLRRALWSGGRAKMPRSTPSHTPMARAATRPAARKKGRKPSARRLMCAGAVGGCLDIPILLIIRISTFSGSLTFHLPCPL
ncbi:MAG: NnrS family protein, partial [Chromatiaceae bacterium]